MEKLSIILGKTVQKISKIKGGGGSALPGLVVERSNPKFIKQILSKLPYGVVVISGTNGKTTTTKIVSELLEKQGLRVFTNKSGSNFVRGVISAILQNISISGKFNYDIAVLELDEAHAVKFSEVAPIDYALLLNVQRDQLDRFGEIDHTAQLLQKVAEKATKCIILNREDSRISKIKAKKRSFFGLSEKLRASMPNDDDFLAGKNSKTQGDEQKAVCILSELKDNKASYQLDGEDYKCKLTLKGSYNAYNAAGALACCLEVLPKANKQQLIEDLEKVDSAFGRGESFTINDAEVEILLVKNPSAFQLSLSSFADDKHDFMIAINDNVADGHDVSWLWNVDFSALPCVKMLSGTRATDMALRLKYDEVEYKHINEDLEVALDKFLNASKKPKRIFTTYTAMLEIRKIISGKSIL